MRRAERGFLLWWEKGGTRQDPNPGAVFSTTDLRICPKERKGGVSILFHKDLEQKSHKPAQTFKWASMAGTHKAPLTHSQQCKDPHQGDFSLSWRPIQGLHLEGRTSYSKLICQLVCGKITTSTQCIFHKKKELFTFSDFQNLIVPSLNGELRNALRPSEQPDFCFMVFERPKPLNTSSKYVIKMNMLSCII